MNEKKWYNSAESATPKEIALPQEFVSILSMGETLDRQLSVLSDRIVELANLLEPICYPDSDELKRPGCAAPKSSPFAILLAGRIDFLTYNIAQLERLIVRINL